MAPAIRVRDPRGFALGWIYVAIALAVFGFGSRLRLGSAVNMGPGYFPSLIAGGLLVVGLLVVLLALRVDGPPIDWRGSSRPLILVSCAVLTFGLALRGVGLLAATLLTILVAGFAGSDTRFRETLAVGVVVTAISYVVFVLGIGMQVPVWPWDIR